jgi:hypothetical protein
MPATMSQAQNQVLALLANALPGSLPVAWPDMAKAPSFPPASGSWARVSITDNGEESPPTLVSSPGNRRTKTIGLLTVQLFTLAGDGRRTAQTLGETILAAFRGQSTEGGVTFRNEYVDHIGPDGIWHHANTYVTYVYSTLT